MIYSETIINLFPFSAQEIEKSHNQNRKTKDGTADGNKGTQATFIPRDWRWDP